eukprot:4199139-Prymnesium_polylepis.1
MADALVAGFRRLHVDHQHRLARVRLGLLVPVDLRVRQLQPVGAVVRHPLDVRRREAQPAGRLLLALFQLRVAVEEHVLGARRCARLAGLEPAQLGLLVE